jgi:hypothetical protein
MPEGNREIGTAIRLSIGRNVVITLVKDDRWAPEFHYTRTYQVNPCEEESVCIFYLLWMPPLRYLFDPNIEDYLAKMIPHPEEYSKISLFPLPLPIN